MGLLDEHTRRLSGQRMSGRWCGCIQALAVLAAVGLVAACGGGSALRRGASRWTGRHAGGRVRRVRLRPHRRARLGDVQPPVRRPHPRGDRARARELQRKDEGAAGAQPARQREQRPGAGGVQRHGRHLRRRRVHRGLPAGADPGRWRLRLEHPRRAAARRPVPAGERGQRRHVPHRPGPQPRSAILRQHKPGVRDRHVRRRADGQPARL